MFVVYVGGMVNPLVIGAHMDSTLFGDRPAAAFLEIAIRRTADMNQHIDMLAATRIKNDRRFLPRSCSFYG